jgi:putative toxin-antitoxin system antitoxin component (TIGR02293 family)
MKKTEKTTLHQHSKSKVANTIELKEPQVLYNLLPTSNNALHYLEGGTKKTAKVINKKHEFIDMIRHGVPRKSMDHLMQSTGITPEEMAAIMHTSERTLRRYEPHKLLNPEQSERIIELARLYSRGEEVLGDKESFKEWMDANVLALGNKKPKTYLDTSLGIELLMEELGKIEQGVFA